MFPLPVGAIDPDLGTCQEKVRVFYRLCIRVAAPMGRGEDVVGT